MASATLSMPLTPATQKKNSGTFNLSPTKPLSKSLFLAKPKSRACRRVQVQASLKEKAAAGLTAAALTAAMVIPEAAEAAGGDLSPSLKNFLLSIVSGGVVLAALVGAVIGVSNFDPVKRS